MQSSKRVLIAIGFIGAAVAFQFLPEAVVHAQGNGNGATKDVVVVNSALSPVPVTGQLTVTGTTTIAGNVQASQQGSWSVGQSGPWTVKIDPAQNAVAVASTPAFFHDTGFGGMNDGGVVEIGPFDMSAVSNLRVSGRAVNGDIIVQLMQIVEPAFPILLDQFTIAGEDGSISATRVYPVPGRNVLVRLTESGPGGSNYHIVLSGR
ncbi:MAG: hypothetical protein ACKVWV_14525 [Planctomycetota bacterium]